jgi:hypothetical protein
MRPITVTVGPLAAGVANNIALSQTPAGAGALTLNGSLVNAAGVAVLDNPRRILITTADTTTTFTIKGTTPTGALLTESFVVSGGSTYSTLDYATVTSITVNQGTTAAVTVGTNGIASTPWVRLDDWALPQIAIQCNVSGTVNYTVQSTLDDPNSPTNPILPSAMNWINSPDTNAVAATAAIQTSYGGYAAYPAMTPAFVRVLLNSGTGTVTATVTQLGVAPY